MDEPDGHQDLHRDESAAVGPADVSARRHLRASLASTYPDCVNPVFPRPKGTMPTAAMVIEADFVTTQIVANSTTTHAGTKGKGGKTCTANPAQTPCYDFFPFPAPAADKKNTDALQGAGDVGMVLHSTPQAKA